MGAKRVKSDSKFEKGERGLAMLTKLDGSRARLDFIESGNSFNIAVDQTGERPTLPANVPYGAMKLNGSIQVSATMAKNEPTVLFCNPASGEFKAKFLQFNSPENTPRLLKLVRERKLERPIECSVCCMRLLRVAGRGRSCGASCMPTLAIQMVTWR